MLGSKHVGHGMISCLVIFSFFLILTFFNFFLTELTGSIDKIDTSHTHDRSNDMIQFTQVRSTKKTLHNNNTTAGKRSINVLPYFRFYLFENILSFFNIL